jgi:hypothetical protein
LLWNVIKFKDRMWFYLWIWLHFITNYQVVRQHLQRWIGIVLCFGFWFIQYQHIHPRINPFIYPSMLSM